METIDLIISLVLALAIPIIWLVAIYRLIRLPFIPYRWPLIALACIPVPIPMDGETDYVTALAPMVLIITFLRPGRQLKKARWDS